MQGMVTTVDEYLAELPADRRAALEAVRNVILANLGPGFREGMQYGMIGYFVPHEVYPPGYHCDPKQPLPFAALASQKNYMSLYLMCGDSKVNDELVKAWAKTGKKLDMGKSCIRFKGVEDLALEVIAKTIGSVSVKNLIAMYDAARSASAKNQPAPKEKVTPKKVVRTLPLKRKSARKK